MTYLNPEVIQSDDLAWQEAVQHRETVIAVCRPQDLQALVTDAQGYLTDRGLPNVFNVICQDTRHVQWSRNPMSSDFHYRLAFEHLEELLMIHKMFRRRDSCLGHARYESRDAE